MKKSNLLLITFLMCICLCFPTFAKNLNKDNDANFQNVISALKEANQSDEDINIESILKSMTTQNIKFSVLKKNNEMTIPLQYRIISFFLECIKLIINLLWKNKIYIVIIGILSLILKIRQRKEKQHEIEKLLNQYKKEGD